MGEGRSGGEDSADLGAVKASFLGSGDPPRLSAADTALPVRLRDMLGTFPDGACQGVAGSGQAVMDEKRTTLTLSLTCVSFPWPAGASVTVAVTGVTAAVTDEGVVTLTLSGTFDEVEVTSTMTAAGAGRLTVAVRPVRPGAFGGELERLGRRFAGDVWQSAQDGMSEFGFDPREVAGFDFRLVKDRSAGLYDLSSVAVVAALDLKGLPLRIALWLPDLRVTGSLRDDTPIGVRSLLESFGIPSGEVPEELAVSDLSFAAALGHAYMVRTKVTGLWSLGPFEIASLSMELSYDPVETFVVNVAGTVAIGSSFGIDVFAAKGFGKGGWSFRGGLPAGADLGMAEVTAAFGLPDVPEPIKSLELTSLWVSCATVAGASVFDLMVQGDMMITEEIRASLGVTVTRDGSGTRYAGTLDIAGYDFEVVFDEDGSGDEVVAATFRGGDDGVEIVLRDLVAHFSDDLAADVPESLRIDLKDAKFVRVRPAGGPARFCVGVDLSASIDLSRLPLVGGFLSQVGTLNVENLQVLYSSADFTAQAVTSVNGLLGQARVVPLPAAGLKAGVAALAELKAGNETTPVALGVPSTTTPAPTGNARSSTPAVPADGAPASTVHWISVQKKLGVVQINRVGVMYQHNVLLFALDAAVALGPLSLSFDGLAVGSPLDRFAPTFDLSGLGVAYNAPPVEISGALLHLPADRLAPDVAFQYDGTATLVLPNYSLAAIGSYAQLKDGEPSLFIFAQLEGTLLELPPILVTGLMAGFGYNRELALPAATEVSGFPLLTLNKQGPDPAGNRPSRVLDVLEGREPAVAGGRPRQWISPRQGSYWLALGVEFTLAKVVNAKVLLAAEFGQELVLALLGTAILQLPLPAESATRTYVYAELGLEAVLRPAKGSFELTAQLSPASYVLTRDCHLTGGFACAVWFGSNPNAGQFVVTLGGYHPAFQRPAYYPVVPRLSVDWSVSGNVSITAQAYLAVTPSCAMAGAMLSAVYQGGGVRAWFTANADLLLSWRPFWFTADISVSVGASYTADFLFVHKTVSVSVGADLDLWGPPVGGTVTVHIVCFSITVRFGHGRPGAGDKTLGWSEFAAMLPKPEEMVTVAAVSGLDKTMDDPAGGGTVWLVRARDLRFFTQAAIPASHLRAGDAPLASPEPGDGPLVDVRPMNRGGLIGEHRLKLYFENAPAPTDGWTLTARTRNVPASLWGATPTSSRDPADMVEAVLEKIMERPTAEVVPDRPVGFDVQAPRPQLAPSRGVFPLSEYSEDELQPGLSPLPRQPTADGDFAFTSEPSCVDLIGRADRGDARNGRDQVYAALADAKLFTGPNDSLADLAGNAGHLFGQAPMTQDAGSRT
ncbi:hypothetical protein GCM10009677_54450 [Sphaerisporangium rubeum]|uniref:DUF6603 domain-containing protein n=1 Tax=Sphaerisporangium rubeum TaxID=321317 RepID=A0A7X0M3U5_9ACTN|nr:DUF6603 domain-containing protein [Sphaerisporangium rubeum]MBB6470988.1 hypothetical protein [Sphaerisporangium rubeum]